jgi:hypothetical protein
VKELARRWYPAVKPPEKKQAHRALDDILESVEELRWYRSRFFLPPEAVPPDPAPEVAGTPAAPATAPEA